MSEHRPRRDGARRTAVLVLGMHRSGTSALTRIVNLLGAALPQDLLPANPTNPAGHWEPNRIVAIHDELLSSIDSSWDDWRPVPRKWFSSAAARSFGRQIETAIVEEFGDHSLFVVKDPRTCRLLPVWSRALEKLQIRPAAVLITRNPLEVARSLQTRDGFEQEKSFRLWLRHVLDAEAESRSMSRCFATYRQVLTAWQPLMIAAESELGITWPRTPSDVVHEVTRFLSDDLHRSRATDSELHEIVRTFPWVLDAYSVFERLAQGAAKKPDRTRLDDIKSRFDEAAAVFGELRSSERRPHDSEARRLGIVPVQQELAVSGQQANHLEEQLTAARKEADRLNRDAAIFKRDAEALLKERATHLREIDGLQGDLINQPQAVELLEQALAAQRLDVRALEQEAHAHRLETDMLRRAVAVQSEMIAGLQKELAGRGDENERLRRELLRQRDEMETLHEELIVRTRLVAAPARGADQALGLRESAAQVPVTPRDDVGLPVRLRGPRFLLITDAIPTPDLDAGSFRLFEILKLLTHIGFRVTFVSHSLEPRAEYANHVLHLGISVIYGAEAALAHLEREGDRYAHVLLSRPDVAFNYLFPVRAHAIRAKVAYDTVDLHWVRMERAAELSGDRQMMESAQYYKRIERFSAAASDVVLALTMPDKDALLKEDASLNIGILPTIHSSADMGGPWHKRRDLMFIGGFWHQPNEDGVCYFVEHILPLVLRELPDVVFNIIGSHMTDRVSNLASSSVRALGYVPDPTVYFTESRVFVSPLRFGAGMKGKIGHSMSHGLPVVTTSIGAEGMMLVDGETALIADDPQSFGQAVIRLYTDERLWQDIAARSVSHIAHHFSEHAARRRLEALFPIEADVIGERPVYAS